MVFQFKPIEIQSIYVEGWSALLIERGQLEAKINTNIAGRQELAI